MGTKVAEAKAALSLVQSGMRVFVHGGAATPSALVDALVGEASRLREVEVIHLHTMASVAYARPEYGKSFRVANLFVSGPMREHLDYDRVDYLPCFLSEIPALFRSGRRPLDVALLQVSPPDTHGFCTLGVSVDVALAALQSAKIAIAQVNPRMPRVHGDGFVHLDQFDHWFEYEQALPESLRQALTPEEVRIGAHVASLIEDGSTLQMGIGSVPDAVLAALSGHRDLGIHTEMWSDGALELLLKGVVNNSKKALHRGKTVSGFVMGSKKLYDFVNDNPSVVQLGIDYVNSPNVIARNPKVVAINSAVEIDLTGQICADSVGDRIISGVGGQMDFMRGAALSEGGKPIIALSARTAKGRSKITPHLAAGAGVVTTRSHVHYVATEFGVADLYGKTLNERAHALIQIAHPDDREPLAKAWREEHRLRS